MITHRICCLVLVAVLVGGCGPGAGSRPRKPVWPLTSELNAEPVAREQPRVRVRKSSGFAETEPGFVKLAPVEEEAPVPTSPDMTTEAASPPQAEAEAESAKAIADKSRETETESTSEKQAPDTLPPPAAASPTVIATEPAKETEPVVQAEKAVESPAPLIPPPTTAAAVDTQKSAVISPPPVPVAPEQKEPAPPVLFTSPAEAIVTDPDKGIATAIPIAPVLPAPAVPSLAVPSLAEEKSTPISPAPEPPSPPVVAESAPAPIVPVVPDPPPATAVNTEKTAESGADKEIAAINQPDTATSAVVPPPTPDPVEIEKAIGFTPANQEVSDQERLAALWTKRRQEQVGAEYPVGPGDVLTINVPGMEELKEQTVRVSTDGTIALPLVGLVPTIGKTGDGVREEIRRRLEADYMHNPQVQLFVKEYRSRQVAVVGAVAKPGLYALASGTETILDMVSQAGGVTDEAASYLQFVPAQPVENGKIKEIAATLPESVTNAHPGLLLMEKTDPVLIDLQNQTAKNSQTYLLLPVWPGDVIMVPGGGEVLIDGWVEKPGSYKISRGLTVLGAIAAAGGSLFAADTSAVKVMRVKGQGEKAIFVANLEQIRAGKQQDIPVQGGDVIEVTASTAKLVPYGMYKFISTIFRVGASAPLF